MLTKNEIILITKNEIGKEPIGYEYLASIGRIIPLFKQPESSYDIPVMSGSWYIDEKTKRMSIMELLDFVEYKGKIQTVMF